MPRASGLLTLAALLLVVAACTGAGAAPATGGATTAAPGAVAEVGRPVRTAAGVYRDLSAAELKTFLERKDFVLVDTHVPNEGRLAETDLRIPYDQIERQLGLLPPAKDARIVLYCMSGRMSQIAAERLVAQGYTRVWNLERGMIGWRAAGYELLPD
ncbi:MAG: rhodanese-like domain-containing protein [Chloroflexi bacterium]|nr:rhodanese-like domain-containing protein [Chloroflexota bacterium]